MEGVLLLFFKLTWQRSCQLLFQFSIAALKIALCHHHIDYSEGNYGESEWAPWWEIKMAFLTGMKKKEVRTSFQPLTWRRSKFRKFTLVNLWLSLSFCYSLHLSKEETWILCLCVRVCRVHVKRIVPHKEKKSKMCLAFITTVQERESWELFPLLFSSASLGPFLWQL